MDCCQQQPNGPNHEDLPTHPLAPSLPSVAGLLQPTDGDALFFPPSSSSGGSAGGGGGQAQPLSIRRDMRAIRSGLGVCPQFDVLWPQLSVREHLELWAAIKGYSR